jgi:hypothetical protein
MRIRTVSFRLAFAVAVTTAFASRAVAQSSAYRGAPAVDSTRHAHAIPVPSVVAVRRTGPIVLDGKLDDEAWKAAVPITHFTQFNPDEGKPPTQRTEVRFLYDDDALYVGAKMYDSAGPAGIMTRLVRRDATFDSDYLELVIDGYHDHLGRAYFDLNPSGAKSDRIGVGTSCCDASWDPVWQGATRIDADGWSAEIRIPFSQLRFSRDSVQTWGLQVRRFIKRRDEEDDWSFWHKNEAGGPPRFGHLEGIHIPPSTSHLELLPYVVAKSTDVATTPGDPFNTHGRPTAQVGLDLTDRLTSNLTLDATVNPDFGQVEVDPAVLNLSAFETFFPEKRPFFVEGSQIFDFGSTSCYFCSNFEGMTAFYSRRVGRAPTGADLAQDDYAYSNVPDATTILGAGKITGRTQSGYTVGLLEAVTGQANAQVASAGGVRGTQEVEPLANYFAGRLKRDFMNGNVVVGGIASGMERRIDTTFAPRLANHAELYGNDLYYAWSHQTYTLRASAAVTNVSGDPREITLREESSARYFQRPDRGSGDGLSGHFDTTATSLRGGGGYMRLAKEQGNWLWEAALNTRTPGYETNDYSFQQHADYIWYDGDLLRQWTKPTRWYNTATVLVGGQTQQNYEGNRTSAQGQLYLSETTPQFWNVTGFYIDRPATLDDQQLRGGPLVRDATAHYAETDVTTDSRHLFTATMTLDDYWDSQGSYNPVASLSVAYRPRSNISLSFGPSWNGAHNVAQYVQPVADTTARSFYGTRYVMSYIRQRTLGLDTRADITFSPTMTLEVYVQPFFAAGHYYNFEEYAAPRSDRLLIYGRNTGTVTPAVGDDGVVSQYTIDPDGAGPAPAFTLANPDFNEQSLRGNAVFRWEYRPGSVLYLAWTQSRDDTQAFGDLQFVRDRSALLATRPDNIFLVKVSWWLPK